MLQLSHTLYCLYPILTGLNMMDTHDTIKQINSDIKEYDKKLVRSSNIPLGYIVDIKNLDIVGTTMSPGRFYQILLNKIPPTLFKFKSPRPKEARGGKRVYNPDTTHMIISIGSTSIIRCIKLYPYIQPKFPVHIHGLTK